MLSSMLGAVLNEEGRNGRSICGNYVCHYWAFHTCVLSKRLMDPLAYHYMGFHNVVTPGLKLLAQCTNHNAEANRQGQAPCCCCGCPGLGKMGTVSSCSNPPIVPWPACQPCPVCWFVNTLCRNGLVPVWLGTNGDAADGGVLRAKGFVPVRWGVTGLVGDCNC